MHIGTSTSAEQRKLEPDPARKEQAGTRTRNQWFSVPRNQEPGPVVLGTPGTRNQWSSVYIWNQLLVVSLDISVSFK